MIFFIDLRQCPVSLPGLASRLKGGCQPVTTILIADEHDVVREGLRTHLEFQPNWKIVAEAADGKEAIQKAVETKPDVAVLAYALPLINGIEVTTQIDNALLDA